MLCFQRYGYKEVLLGKRGAGTLFGNTTLRMLKVMILDAKSQPLVAMNIFITFESVAWTNTLKRNIADKQHGLIGALLWDVHNHSPALQTMLPDPKEFYISVMLLQCHSLD